MDKLTGGQTGGGRFALNDNNEVIEVDDNSGPFNTRAEAEAAKTAGGRRRKSHRGHKGNSWLAHVKATMKLHPGKSFKQVLKIAKKTYKRSQSSSQSGGKRRKRQNQKSQKKYQNGGSGGKMEGVGKYATPV